MSMISRTVSNPFVSLKLNGGFNHLFRQVRFLESTATDSTADTMHLDSESQQEDPGYRSSLLSSLSLSLDC